MSTTTTNPIVTKTHENLIGPKSAAGFSTCGTYRYWLRRTWDESREPVVFLMLNPSTADESKNDPTVARCCNFAQAWGAGGLVVLNLFALRSTDPKGLYACPDPVGPSNDFAILTATEGRRVVAAWGCHGAYKNRDLAVMNLLAHRPVECLKVTKDGHPSHPLYLRGDSVPMSYTPRASR